jgi:hypothetical protein
LTVEIRKRDLPARYFSGFERNGQLYSRNPERIGRGIHPYFLIQSSVIIAAPDNLTFRMLVCCGSRFNLTTPK